jgi:hypothetical protein
MWHVSGIHASFSTSYLGSSFLEVGSRIRKYRLDFLKNTTRHEELTKLHTNSPSSVSYEQALHMVDGYFHRLQDMGEECCQAWLTLLNSHNNLFSKSSVLASTISKQNSMYKKEREKDNGAYLSSVDKQTSRDQHMRRGNKFIWNLGQIFVPRYGFYRSISAYSSLGSLVRDVDKYPNDLKKQADLLKVGGQKSLRWSEERE